ncbi:MAG: dephospho-CoA kinase [Syntrophomonadaceae bacterium]|nr:dephospho-CoA kinase [Syntrophomonadaceae bacterium]
MIIGLTGGIASGKSTVSQRLAELGAVIIDGDAIAHRLMEPYQPTWEDIVKEFGQEILNPDETIDRTKLGGIVFDDPRRMTALNQITRAGIIETIKNDLHRLQKTRPESVLVLDVPLLYEAHLDKLVDQVWVVWLDRETQIARLMKRNGYTREEALKRIESQMSLDEKAKRADLIIDNRGSMEETLRIATKYYLDILQ